MKKLKDELWRKLIASSKFNIILIIVAIMQFAFVVYVNLCRIDITMDNDVAKLFVHAIEMYKNKTVFISNWSNMTTLEVDCATLFALPIYAVCKNIYISFGIANVVILLIYLLLVNSILNLAKVKEVYKILFFIILMTPLSFGQLLYFNMMFFAGGQYSIKVMVALLLIWLINSNKNGVKWWLIAAFTVFLCLLTGVSSGPYILVASILPIVLAYILIEVFQRNSIFDKLLCRNNVLVASSVCAALLGVVICKYKHVNTTGLSITNSSLSNFQTNFIFFISSYLEMFGSYSYDNNCSILSIKGITCALRLVFALVVLVVFVIYIKRIYNMLIHRTKVQSVSEVFESEKDKIILYIVTIIITNIIILLVTANFTEPRYYLISIVLMLLLITIWLSECDGGFISSFDEFELSNKSGCRTLVLIVAAIVVITIGSDYLVMKDDCMPQTTLENIKSHRLADVLSKYDDHVVIIYDDTAEAEMMRMIDYDSDKLYLAYRVEWDSFSNAGIGVHDYYDDPNYDDLLYGPHLMVFNDLLTDMSLVESMYGNEYDKIDEYQNYKIFRKK